MNMKKFITSVIVISMVGTSGSAFASESQKGIPNKSITQEKYQSSLSNQEEFQNWSTISDVVIDDEVIGTRTTEFDYDRQVEGDSTKVKLITTTTYQFNEKATVEEKEVLKDSTNVFDVFVEQENASLSINGVEVPEEVLEEEIALTPSFGNSLPNTRGVSQAQAYDRGGLPAVSHYYGDFRTYAFGSYSDISFWTGAPKGDNVQKTGVKVSNPYFTVAKISIDNFAASNTNTNLALGVLGTELGFAVLTFSTVLVALAAGGAAAVTAGQVSESWNATKTNLYQAYNYIKNM